MTAQLKVQRQVRGSVSCKIHDQIVCQVYDDVFTRIDNNNNLHILRGMVRGMREKMRQVNPNSNI